MQTDEMRVYNVTFIGSNENGSLPVFSRIEAVTSVRSVFYTILFRVRLKPAIARLVLQRVPLIEHIR